MKKIKRKYITVSAVLTAASAGIAYLISGRWQAAAWSGGIVLTVMIVIALLVGALIQKGVDLAVDTAGNWLKKALWYGSWRKGPKRPLHRPRRIPLQPEKIPVRPGTIQA